MIKSRKLKKLLNDPAKFFLDSKFFFFRKIGQNLVNFGFKNRNTSSTASRDLISKNENFKQSEKIEKKEKGLFFVSDALDPRILKVIKKMTSMAELSIEAGDFDLEFENDFEAVVQFDNDIVKIVFDRSAFFEIGDQIYLKKGVDSLFSLVFSDVSDEVLAVINNINIAFWKLANDEKSLFYFYKDKPSVNKLSVVNYGLKGGCYSKDLTTMAVNVLVENRSLTDAQINFIFSKLYRIRGANAETEIAVNAILKERKRLNPGTLMKLAAFLCEAGDYSRCVDVAKLAKSSWENNRYIGLSNFLFKEKIVNDEWAQQDSYYFDLLKKNQNLFLDQVSKAKSNFSIVGNSPCELGQRKSELIDSSNCIIRFNSANVDYPNNLDYGSKTNILIINPRYYETKRNFKSELELIVISDGSLYSTKNLAYRLHDLSEDAPVCIIPDRVDRELVALLEASPSSGMKILYWIYLSTGFIPRENIFGFSMTDQQDGISTNYALAEKRVLPIIHDWKAERNLFEKLIK